MNAISHCKSPYCVIEIPLLTNKSNYPYLNRILLVTSTPEQQVARIVSRDHCTHEQAEALLATTRDDEHQRRAIADDVVINDSSLDALSIQVHSLNDRYLNEAAMRHGSCK